jgi:hypothetical protein
MGWVEVDGQMIDPNQLLGDLHGAPLVGVGAPSAIAERDRAIRNA